MGKLLEIRVAKGVESLEREGALTPETTNRVIGDALKRHRAKSGAPVTRVYYKRKNYEVIVLIAEKPSQVGIGYKLNAPPPPTIAVMTPEDMDALCLPGTPERANMDKWLKDSREAVPKGPL